MKIVVNNGWKILLGLSFWISYAVVASELSVVDSSPFLTANRTTLIRSLGLPIAQDARWHEPRFSEQSLTAELTSQFFVDDSGAEQAMFDAETSTITWRFRYQYNSNFRWGVDVPYISHRAGFLDGFVDGWHKTFGLPTGRRDEFPRDQINLSVQGKEQGSANNSEINVSQRERGLGDVALHAAWLINSAAFDSTLSKTSPNSRAAYSAVLNIELPTGDEDKLLGSNSWDIALGLNAYNSKWFAMINARVNAYIGILLPGDSTLLPQQQRDVVMVGSALLAWPFLDKAVTLKAQLDTHSAFYDSEIKALGRSSLQLTFGGSVPLSKRWTLDLGMSEDIAPRTAPDFTWMLSLRMR